MHKNSTYGTIFDLCDLVRESAFSLHQYLRHGHLEKVYENGLAHRLAKQSLGIVQQCPLHVMDEDGTVFGDYFADLLIEERLLVEIKAVRALAPEHTAKFLAACEAPG